MTTDASGQSHEQRRWDWRGRNSAGRSSRHLGQRRLQSLASADTPEKRSVEGKTWVWIWNGAGDWYNQNTQAQIVADKKSYQVGDVAHLLLVTGLKDCWAVMTAEGNSVQSRQLIHATGESFAFDVPITKLAQPNLVVNAVIVHTAHA